MAGGKLTTHRATGEAVVKRALRRLPRERRNAAGPSRTAKLPLREDTVTDGNCPDKILSNAPEPAHGFFAVPKVVE